MECSICPRNCRVNRNEGAIGYCGMSNKLKVARAALHMWEEPVISGNQGSGTIFFSGCPLRCVYCQNHDIAIGKAGKEITEDRLVEIFFELKEKGAHNINLVTPTHYIPQIRKALSRAKSQNLGLPVVYNTGSYEHSESLRQLEGLIDIYLPDMKYFSVKLGKKYSNAPDYFDMAAKAIREMVRQTGTPWFYKENNREKIFEYSDEELLMGGGVIVRHLLLPGCVEDSKKVIKYLYETYGTKIFISIMNQYTPLEATGHFPELGRKVTEQEYEEVVDYAVSIGVENGFIQEGDTASESFIPVFDNEGV